MQFYDSKYKFMCNEDSERLNNMANIYGSHLAMRLMIEKDMMGRVGRMPGETKSNLGIFVRIQ